MYTTEILDLCVTRWVNESMNYIGSWVTKSDPSSTLIGMMHCSIKSVIVSQWIELKELFYNSLFSNEYTRKLFVCKRE